jgi:ADP-ribose pyrophosphatase
MRIKEFKKLTDSRWLNLFRIHFTDKSGHMRDWQLASRHHEPKCVSGRFERPDAVVIVAFHAAHRKLVITREYRVPLADYEYGFPAGLIDADESIQQATCRELKEETGLRMTRFWGMSPPLYSSAGMTDEAVAMVYVTCDGHPSSALNEGAEEIEVLFVSQDEAAALCRDSALKFDAKAWLVLAHWAQPQVTPLGQM